MHERGTLDGKPSETGAHECKRGSTVVRPASRENGRPAVRPKPQGVVRRAGLPCATGCGQAGSLAARQ